MEYPDFSFYNSENDGYRVASATIPTPFPPLVVLLIPASPRRKRGAASALPLFCWPALLWAAERALAARPCTKV